MGRNWNISNGPKVQKWRKGEWNINLSWLCCLIVIPLNLSLWNEKVMINQSPTFTGCKFWRFQPHTSKHIDTKWEINGVGGERTIFYLTGLPLANAPNDRCCQLSHYNLWKEERVLIVISIRTIKFLSIYLFILSDELPCKGSTKYEKELIITMNVPVDHMTHNRIFIEIF